MNARSEHVEFETLNDYVDGRLDSRTIAFVDKHLAVCTDCASELASLQELIASTATLSRSVLPDDDLWSELRASIEQRKEAVLPTAASAGRQQQSWWQAPRTLIAAAVVLVAATSLITTSVVKRSMSTQQTAESAPQLREPGAPPVLPFSFRVAEGQYMSAIDELRLAVDAQRAQLSPETIQTVDHSLAVVDSAIAEARAALLADPNNRTLVDLLSTTYQRKLDLLRRTSELTSKI